MARVWANDEWAIDTLPAETIGMLPVGASGDDSQIPPPSDEVIVWQIRDGYWYGSTPYQIDAFRGPRVRLDARDFGIVLG